MSGFTKLFSEIITSSIWGEDDKTRLVWITMLASCDAGGVVRASVSGLAHIARVEKGACERAIEVLISPDEDSRSKEFKGRRIEKCDGGWQILNYIKYREKRQQDERKAYMANYMREYRQSHPTVNNPVNSKQKLTMLAKAEAEAEAEADSSSCGTKPPEPAAAATAASLVEGLVKNHAQGVDDAKDIELSTMQPIEAMALLQREHPDIDVWGEWQKLKQRCKDQGTKPTWRGFIGWLRKASPVANIPKKTKIEDVPTAPDPEQEAQARAESIRTLKEWRKAGASYTGIQNRLNGQGGESSTRK